MCELCSEHYTIKLDDDKFVWINDAPFDIGQTMVIKDGTSIVRMDIKYCPMCGRKLDDV